MAQEALVARSRHALRLVAGNVLILVLHGATDHQQHPAVLVVLALVQVVVQELHSHRDAQVALVDVVGAVQVVAVQGVQVDVVDHAHIHVAHHARHLVLEDAT